MHPELKAVIDEFESALVRLHALRDTVPACKWIDRPGPDRWSIAECVAHLNLTSSAFLPLLRTGLDEARRSGHKAPVRYHRDLTGWLLWKSMGPPVKRKFATMAPFVPRSDRNSADHVAEFERLQAEQLALAREADRLPIQRVKIASPFNTRVYYNLFSALSILPRHQHRHLWQAEQVLK
ncbi:MAG TPA: DinB family protein [Vicinamibacterales bacterium]